MNILQRQALFCRDLCRKTQFAGAILKGGSEDFRRSGGKIPENRALTDVILGLMVDFLWVNDVNAGGLRPEKGQGILHLGFSCALKLHTMIGNKPPQSHCMIVEATTAIGTHFWLSSHGQDL